MPSFLARLQTKSCEYRAQRAFEKVCEQGRRRLDPEKRYAAVKTRSRTRSRPMLQRTLSGVTQCVPLCLLARKGSRVGEAPAVRRLRLAEENVAAPCASVAEVA